MSRQPKSHESKSEAERAVAHAERVLEHALEELTSRRIAYAKSDELWIQDGSKRAREARSEASDNLERCEVIHTRAAEQVEKAKAGLQEIIVAEKTADLVAMREELARFGATITAHADHFVELDRAVDGRVLALATELRSAIEVHDAATAIARELHLPPECGVRPDLQNLSLDVRRLVTAARAADGRDALAPHWLGQANTDWRTKDLDAQNMSFIERNARIERDKRIAAQAAADAFEAGHAAGKESALAPPRAPLTAVQTEQMAKLIEAIPAATEAP
jgi:hypothetical protein